MRYRFLRWLNYKVFKTPVGELSPRIIRILHFILFPLHGLYAKQSQVKFDLMTDSYTIRGVTIHVGFFDSLSRDADCGVKFKFVKNNKGHVTLELLR